MGAIPLFNKNHLLLLYLKTADKFQRWSFQLSNFILEMTGMKVLFRNVCHRVPHK
jgi:hypothetical protein